jgi:hypothetical protein
MQTPGVSPSRASSFGAYQSDASVALCPQLQRRCEPQQFSHTLCACRNACRTPSTAPPPMTTPITSFFISPPSFLGERNG